MKYLGAFEGKPIMYNIFRQNRQFRDKNISFELTFSGKLQKSLILRLA